MGWWPSGDRSMIASLRLPSPTPAVGSTQAPSSSGPRCARASVMPTICRRIASGPRFLPGSRKPAMPHTMSLWIFVVDDPAYEGVQLRLHYGLWSLIGRIARYHQRTMAESCDLLVASSKYVKRRRRCDRAPSAHTCLPSSPWTRAFGMLDLIGPNVRQQLEDAPLRTRGMLELFSRPF